MNKSVLKKVDGHEFDQVYDHIRIPSDPPHLTLIAGPCRVGTTALGNVFARTGLTSYMQPIKSMRRAIENGEEIVDWEISANGGGVATKETFGIKTESEYFDPIDILVKAGYPKDKISLIAIMREPERTLTSWTWMWEEVLIDGFARAYMDTYGMVRRAEERGVSTTCYVHEAIRDNDPLLVVGRLFGRVLPVEVGADNSSVDWTGGQNFDDSKQVRFFDEPPERFVYAVKTWGGYQYRELIPDLADEQKAYLANRGIYEIYDRFRQRCQQDLGIKVSKSAKVVDTGDFETKDTNS
jgi:hypothetical protein